MQGLNNVRGPSQHPLPQATIPSYAPSNLDDAQKEALSNFSKAWAAALEMPNDHEARVAFGNALSMIGFTTGHPELQTAVADCLRAGCERWAQGVGGLEFGRELCNNFVLSGLDLSMLPFDQLSFLSNLISDQMVALVPPGEGPSPFSVALMLNSVPALHRVLPSEARARLEADIANFVRQASTSGTRVWQPAVVMPALQALECISDPQLQMSVSVDLLASTLLRNPGGLTAPDQTAFQWAVKKIIDRSRDLTPEQLMTHVDRMTRLSEQPRGTIDPFRRKHVLEACVSALRLCAEPKAFAARLIPALVNEVGGADPSQSVQFLAAAVALADHGNVPVGIALHKYVDNLEEGHVERLGQANLITLAVLSFHVDPGTGSYYLAHEHDLPARTGSARTTHIEYPDWLLDMRRILSDVWGSRVDNEDADQRALIGAALLPAMQNSLSPTARNDFAPRGTFEQLTEGLIQHAVGPRVRVADWSDLQQRLYEELNS